MAKIMELQIGIFGLGFVGLTTSLGFAEKGFRTRGFDIDLKRRETITNGYLPFLEPGLDTVLRHYLGREFLISQSATETAKESDIIFFCVGTPCGKNGRADLRYLFSALDNILPVIQDEKPRILVIKSTVPPGTTQNEIIPHIRTKWDFDETKLMIANNPEFLREGKCWEDFINPDRIVCGVENEKTTGILQELYNPFNAPLYFVSLNTGEFIKYLSNTLLASLISFSNEMSIIADRVGNVDTGKAFRILHEDKRLRGSGINAYIYPGCGFGGYCLPKDTQAMAENARSAGFEPGILREVIKTNDGMPEFFAKKIKATAQPDTPIGILGLSFKPESDDVRESQAAKIIKLLLADGYTNLYAYDPSSNASFDEMYRLPHVRYLSSAKAVCGAGTVLVVVTAWEEFKNLQLTFPSKTWIDCRYFIVKKGAA
jgi:UDPglucose 6-dehydrogenase